MQLRVSLSYVAAILRIFAISDALIEPLLESVLMTFIIFYGL